MIRPNLDDATDLLAHELPQPVRSIRVDSTNQLHFFNLSDLLPDNIPEQYRLNGDWLASMQSSATFYQMVHQGPTKSQTHKRNYFGEVSKYDVGCRISKRQDKQDQLTLQLNKD